MNELLAALKPLAVQAKALQARFDALAVRERAAVFGAVLALVVAVEWLAVQPLRAQRELIEQATIEQIQRTADEREDTERAAQLRQTALQQQLAAVNEELERLGAGASGGQPLSFLLERALAGQPVQVVALRELMVEAIVAPQAGDAHADAAAAAEPAAEPSAPPTLYRHRFEVTLGGRHGDLLTVLAALDRAARPLRIERARLRGASDTELELAVTLAVIGTERVWLTI